MSWLLNQFGERIAPDAPWLRPSRELPLERGPVRIVRPRLRLRSKLWAAISIDGTSSYYADTTGTTGVMSGALVSSNADNVICVGVRTNGCFVTSISDTDGNTGSFSLFAHIALDGTTTNWVDLWTAVCSGTHNGTITVNYSAGTAFSTAHAFAIAGVDTATVFDPGLPDTGGGSPGAGDPRTLSTSNANDIILGVFAMQSELNPTAGTGYTQILGNTGGGALLTEYKIVSATQSGLSVTIGTGAGDANGGIALAMVQAGGGGPSGKPTHYYSQMRRQAH